MGDMSITVSNAAGFQPGMVLMIDRYLNSIASSPSGGGGGAPSFWGHPDRPNETEFIFTMGYDFLRGQTGNNSLGPRPATATEPRGVRQYLEVDYVAGNVVHLRTPLNIDFPLVSEYGKNLNPQVWRTRGEEFRYIGLEDMTVQSVSPGWNVTWSAMMRMQLASSYSWIKNIESNGWYGGWQGRHVEMLGFRNTIRDTWVRGDSHQNFGGNSYGICIRGGDGLIENNVAGQHNKPMQGGTTAGGNVIAHNWVDNTRLWAREFQETALNGSHAGFSHADLYEGNYAANLTCDSTWGTDGGLVYFRNYSFGQDSDFVPTLNRRAMGFGVGKHRFNSIGNVLLSPETLQINTNFRLFSLPASVTADEVPAQYRGGTGNDIIVYSLGDTRPEFQTPNVSRRTFDTFHRHMDFVNGTFPGSGFYLNPENPVTDLPAVQNLPHSSTALHGRLLIRRAQPMNSVSPACPPLTGCTASTALPKVMPKRLRLAIRTEIPSRLQQRGLPTVPTMYA
jgi:hypothetical protein